MKFFKTSERSNFNQSRGTSMIFQTKILLLFAISRTATQFVRPGSSDTIFSNFKIWLIKKENFEKCGEA